MKHSDNDLLNSSEKRLLVLYSIVKMINFSMLRSIKLRNYLLKKSRLEDFLKGSETWYLVGTGVNHNQH